MSWPTRLRVAGISILGSQVSKFYDLDPFPVWPHTHIEQIDNTIYIVSEIRFYRDRQLHARFCLESMDIFGGVSNSELVNRLNQRLDDAAHRVITSAIYNSEFDKIINYDQE